jgi:hypothetical protein
MFEKLKIIKLHMELSPAAQLVIALAAREAVHLDAVELEAEHIILGLLKAEDLLSMGDPALNDGEVSAEIAVLCAHWTTKQLACRVLRRRLRSILHKGNHLRGEFSGHRSEPCYALFDVAEYISHERFENDIDLMSLLVAAVKSDGPYLNALYTRCEIDSAHLLPDIDKTNRAWLTSFMNANLGSAAVSRPYLSKLEGLRPRERSEREVVDSLLDMLPRLEQRYGLHIPAELVQSIASLCQRHTMRMAGLEIAQSILYDACLRRWLLSITTSIPGEGESATLATDDVYQAVARRLTGQERMRLIEAALRDEDRDRTPATDVLPAITNYQILPAQPQYLNLALNLLKSKDYAEVRLEKLDGGYESTGVYVVRGENASGHQFVDRVLKLGARRDILEEPPHYKQYVEGFLSHTPGRPVASSAQGTAADGNAPAGILYEFAQMGHNSGVRNLQSLYLDPAIPDDAVVQAVTESLALLARGWYEGGEVKRINPYREYPRLLRRLDTVMTAVGQMTGGDQDRPTITLRGRTLTNPATFLDQVYRSRAEDRNVLFIYWSTVHGDLHSRNILVEHSSQPLTWFIDFSKTQVAPTLRDFCSLEADLKVGQALAGREPSDPELTARTWDLLVRAEERFSPWINSFAAFVPTADDLAFLSDVPELRRAWLCIGAIRRLAQRYVNVSSDWSAYTLPLLYSTMPITYYRQCGRLQREYALFSASRLCDALK